METMSSTPSSLPPPHPQNGINQSIFCFPLFFCEAFCFPRINHPTSQRFSMQFVPLEESNKAQPTVIMRQPEHTVPQPRDHIVWSLCSLVYGNPCCGLLAVYYSIKSRDRKVVGDLEGARQYGTTARCYNIVTLTLTIIAILFFIIIYAVVIQNLSQSYDEFQKNNG